MKNFRKFLTEGGNASVYQDGKLVAQAEKIDLSKIDRNDVTEQVKRMMYELDAEFEKVYGIPIWEHLGMIAFGNVFAGSSRFFMDDEISDEEFKAHKPTVGDIDVQVPHALKEPLDKLLVPGKIFGGMKYVGRADTSLQQLNTVWEATLSGIPVMIQCDFEPVEYIKGLPSPWSEFAHSADWGDIKAGIKGVFHKYLIGAVDFAYQKPITVLTRKTLKPKKIDAHDYAFSVEKGVREKYVLAKDEKGKPIMVGGEQAFFEIDPKEADYITDIASIYEVLFRIVPSSSDLQKFKSFTGVVDLIDAEFSGSQQAMIADEFLKRCWGKGAQALERDAPEIDAKAKWAAVNYLADKLQMPSIIKKAELLVGEYYKSYKMSADRLKSSR